MQWQSPNRILLPIMAVCAMACNNNPPTAPPPTPALVSIQQGPATTPFSPSATGTVVVSQALVQDVIVVIETAWPTTHGVRVLWSGQKAAGGDAAVQLSSGSLGSERTSRENNDPFYVVENVDPNVSPVKVTLRIGVPLALGCQLEAYRIVLTAANSAGTSSPLTIDVKEVFGPRGLVSGKGAIAISTPLCGNAQAWTVEENTSGAPITNFHQLQGASILINPPQAPGRVVGVGARNAGIGTWRLVAWGRKQDGSLYRAGASAPILFSAKFGSATTTIIMDGQMNVELTAFSTDPLLGTDLYGETKDVVALLRLKDPSSPQYGDVIQVCNADAAGGIRMYSEDTYGVHKGDLAGPSIALSACSSSFITQRSDASWWGRVPAGPLGSTGAVKAMYIVGWSIPP